MATANELTQRLNDALKSAMKAQDRLRMSVVRMLLSEIRTAQLADTAEHPSPSQVVAAYAKRLWKSTDEYRRLEHPERADEIERELAVVEEFLPRQMGRGEIEAVVERILQEQGISSPRQMSQVMKLVMQQYGDQVDGKLVQEVVRAKLGSA